MGFNFLKYRGTQKKNASSSTPKLRHKEGDETSTYSDTSGASKPSLLESLARDGKWKAFLKLAENSSSDDWMNGVNPDSSLHSSNDDSTSSSVLQPNKCTTPLHIALCYQPTVCVVESLITLLRDRFNVLVPEEFQDDQGRTPLHIAATYPCEEAITARLLSGPTLLMPAVLRDNVGRTPLHWATDAVVGKSPAGRFGRRKQTVAMERWHQGRTMAVLMNHYSEGANLKDDSGKTPLDYALAQTKMNMAALGRLQRLVNMQEAEQDREVDSNLDDGLCDASPVPDMVTSSCRCTDADDVASTDLFVE